MGLLRRMNTLKELFHVRVGPGSAVLPRNVTRIHMQFSHQWLEGQLECRRFWQNYLPRLKYHNPAVSIFVDRKQDRNVAAEILVYTASRGAKGATKASPAELEKARAPGGPESSKVVEAAEGEEVKRLDLQFKKREQIWTDFLALTGAKEVQHTPEELAQWDEYKRINAEKKIDSAKKKAVAAKLNAEKKMEEMARAAAAAAI